MLVPRNSFTPNINRLRTKLAALLSAGATCLKIVTDFDFTLSHPNYFSSWMCIEKNPMLSPKYLETTLALSKKYYPMEISTTLTLEEKSDACALWWAGSCQAIVDENVTREKYDKLCQFARENIIFRDHSVELFSYSRDLNVPVLIFSAGIGDMIDASLLRDCQGFYSPMNPYYPIEPLDNKTTSDYKDTPRSIYVIANDLLFRSAGDENTLNPYDQTTFKPTDYVCGFQKSPPIHVFNKVQKLIVDEPYYQTHIKPRNNVILMGDSLGDAAMVDDDEFNTNVIRVGFINTALSKSVETHLQNYLEKFDIIFVDNDGGVKLCADILQHLKAQASPSHLQSPPEAPSSAQDISSDEFVANMLKNVVEVPLK